MPPLPDFNFELSQLPGSTRFLLGIDEVGRGPLAGPVTVGAFLLDLQLFDPSFFSRLGVRDSKLLSASKRQAIVSSFQRQPFRYLTVSASSLQIDQKGINLTIKGLILFVLQKFRGSFDFCLIDGNYPFSSTSVKSVVQADQHCFSVASASICAKVARDLTMDKYDSLYPAYGFGQHKGYGTAKHLSSLHLHGPCPIHRRSYQPVKKLLTSSS